MGYVHGSTSIIKVGYVETATPTGVQAAALNAGRTIAVINAAAMHFLAPFEPATIVVTGDPIFATTYYFGADEIIKYFEAGGHKYWVWLARGGAAVSFGSNDPAWTGLTGGSTVTISAYYIPMGNCIVAKSWSLDAKQEAKDVSTISGSKWRSKAPGLKDVSGNIEFMALTGAAPAWRAAVFGDGTLVGDKVLGLELYVPSSTRNIKFELLVIPSDNVKHSIEDYSTETVSFETAERPFFSVS